MIKTIAVIHVETTGLPEEQQNTCAITELCIYAFSSACLSGHKGDSPKPQILPRVLHKINMMIKPNREIQAEAVKESGLTNSLLEKEAPFDENTSNCLFMFLERLDPPVCFVAHNGLSFDYPIIRNALQTINKKMPSSIFCIDTLEAFREFDEKEQQINSTKELAVETENRLCAINKYRQVFSEPFTPESRYPKKGVYRLGNIYKRIFDENANNKHLAEADVAVLTKLILHYGLVFLAYVEERKQSFDEVLPLGFCS